MNSSHFSITAMRVLDWKRGVALKMEIGGESGAVKVNG
jgi:hypothetical protein